MAIPAGYVRVTLPFVGDSVPTGAANVLCFSNVGDLDADAIQVAINSAAGTDPWGYSSNTMSCPTMLIKFGPDSTGPLESRACAIVGGSGDAAGYAGASYLIRKATASGGRRGRGRIYIPAVPEVRISVGGFIDELTVSGLQADTDTFFEQLSISGLNLCVEHTDGTTPALVTSLTVDGRAATQRRRQRR